MSLLTYPLSPEDARQHLQDALGSNYGGPTDGAALTRALAVDSVQVGDVAHLRPWATAARLIRFNTEYEVDQGLAARIDRKLNGLDAQQSGADAAAGIAHLVSAADDSAGHGFSGSLRVKAVY